MKEVIFMEKDFAVEKVKEYLNSLSNSQEFLDIASNELCNNFEFAESGYSLSEMCFDAITAALRIHQKNKEFYNNGT